MWKPDLRLKSQAPFILVGTKLDLRDDPDTLAELSLRRDMPVTREEGAAAAKQLGAAAYLECSALTKEGIQRVFEEVGLVAAERRRKAEASEAKETKGGKDATTGVCGCLKRLFGRCSQ